MSSHQVLESIGERIERGPAEMARFMQLLLRVRDREGRLRPLAANPAQLAFEGRRTRHNIVLKARQMGITTWVAGRFFLKTITQRGTLTLQVAHTRAAAESIFGIAERMWRELPAEFREGPLKRSRANVGQMVFPALDSEFRVASASDIGVGRGLSIRNLHCSELSRWPGNATETLAGLRAALAPGGELVLESTPNGAYGCFYDEWQAAVEGPGPKMQGEEDRANLLDPGPCALNPVSRHFLPWWLEPAYTGNAIDRAAMTDAELLLVARHSLSENQIGFRRGLERSYGALRSQEFAEDAETCFRATGACCFDVDALDSRMAEAPAPREVRRGGALQVWLPPQPGREYILAADSAGGGDDGDFAAVQVVERTTGLQCAELQQRLRPAELAHACAVLAREYNHALVVVERNNHGAAVLAYLETREHYARIWWPHSGTQPGWLTTAASKPEIIARLGALLEESPERFLSRRLLAECRSFVTNARGQTAAAAGAHDDLVMAMAIAHAVRAEGVSSK